MFAGKSWFKMSYSTPSMCCLCQGYRTIQVKLLLEKSKFSCVVYLLAEAGSRFQQTFELSDPGQGYQTYLTNLPVNKKQVFQSFSASYICLQRLAQGFSHPHLAWTRVIELTWQIKKSKRTKRFASS
jgi:hypothetical protein